MVDINGEVTVAKKPTRAKKVEKVGAGKTMYISIDNKPEDVLQFVQDGYTLKFRDVDDTGKKVFLQLPIEVYKELSLADKEAYMMAKEIVSGADVIGTVTDGVRGWKRSFNVTAGDPSSKLQVLGKNKGYEYFWERDERVGMKEATGWEIDCDPNVQTYDQAESEVGQAVPKTVGGRKASELVLMRRRKDLGAKIRAEEAKRTALQVTKAKDGYKEGVERLGAKASSD